MPTMKRVTLRMLPLMSATLLFVAAAGATAAAQTPTPVELSDIRLYYKLENETTFNPTDAADPVVPATTEALRFTATVVGHRQGDKILVRAAVNRNASAVN